MEWSGVEEVVMQPPPAATVASSRLAPSITTTPRDGLTTAQQGALSTCPQPSARRGDAMEVLYLVLALFVGGALLWRLSPKRRKLLNAVRNIPGPFKFPLIGTAHHFLMMKKHGFFELINKVIKEFGPFFITWNGEKPEVHIYDAEDIEVLLGSSINISKGFGYTFLHPWLGLGLLTSAGAKWHSRRKLITPTFHFKILENFQEVVAENSLLLVKKLEKELGSSKGFDVYPYITHCALDIICETAMGTKINAQGGANSPYVSAIYDISELIVDRMSRPWLHPDFLYFLTNDGQRYKECLRILHGFSDKVIKERRQSLLGAPKSDSEPEVVGRKRRMAFLDLLLEASKGDPSLTDEEIRHEVDTFMFEGHDTTSASLCWTLFILGNSLDVQDRAYQEQKEIFGDSERSPEMNDLSEMKYLERVLKESLRVYPSVPMIGRTLTQDVQMGGGHTVPADCQVTMHIFHAHRNPKYFPNPDQFDPDNFLPERVRGRHPYAYIPFSAGSRNCIGQKFALLEEKTMLSAILRNFRVKALEGPNDVTLVGELILRPLHGVHIALERR